MSKKVQFVVWLIIAVAVFGLLGLVVYNTVIRTTEEVKHPEVTFELENYGTVKLELYPEYAPNTVANIIKLVEKGYYNNKVVYGKDALCLYVGRTTEGEDESPKISLLDNNIEKDSEADYEYTIKGEFIANGFEQNTLRHEKGIVTLIRNDYSQYLTGLSEESYNSGNAQLGIMMNDDVDALNGAYAAFGKVIEGLDILERIYTNEEMKPVETSEDGSTANDDIEQFAAYPVIKSATVDTKGENFGMPKTQEAFDYESYMYDLMNASYSN